MKDAGPAADNSRVSERVSKTDPRIQVVLILKISLILIASAKHQSECLAELEVILREKGEFRLAQVKLGLATGDPVFQRLAGKIAGKIRKCEFARKIFFG